MSFISFPKEFLWGTATSSYQIEGGADADGKGESIWDRYSRTPGMVLNNDTGDVACDHYHRWEEDLRLIRDLGATTYRLSLSWPRILPEGTGKVNQKGLDFYSRLIDRLLEYNITPNVTLYHWDLPQALEDRGGWVSRDSVQWFSDYAEVVFKHLGDRVPMWSTINEPWVVAWLGYGLGAMAPGFQDFSKGMQASHHLLTAHANAVQKFKMLGCPGKIGIVLNTAHHAPVSDKPEDVLAAERADDFINHIFMKPLYHGEYPQAFIDYIGRSAPVMEAGDLALIKNSADWLGINYYSSNKVEHSSGGGLLKNINSRYSVSLFGQTQVGWGIYPEGLTKLLLDIKNKYGSPIIYITENGMADNDQPDANGFVKDRGRIVYLREHLLAVNDAMQQGADVRGYYIWSFMDNFEWSSGYWPRFGIVRVDYDTQRRIPKQSYHWYSEIIQQNGLWE